MQLTQFISRKNCNIYFYNIGCENCRKSYCVKQVLNLKKDKVNQLFIKGKTLYSILAVSGVHSTEFIAHDEHTNSVLMPSITGDTLEKLIIQSFFKGEKSHLKCLNLLAALADQQAIMHATKIPDNLPMPTPCSNLEYENRLAEYLDIGFIQQALTFAEETPQQKIAALGESFKEGMENVLLHGDFQAKNVLIDKHNSAVLIDLNYGLGHPLFDIAQFLTQLVRLHRTWNFPKAKSYLEQYGDHFLKVYFSHGNEHLKKDLPFFMLWAMAFSLRGDLTMPAFVKRYIGSHIKASVMYKKWAGISQ